MTRVIDTRVVEMQFDNKQFEGNVKTTLDTIVELKKGLNFDGSAKSLSALTDVAKTFSLASIADGVQSISDRFSAFGVIGFTVIKNLTEGFMGLANQLWNSLAIDPMKMGFSEYETQMGAIQTVLANTSTKGTTLDQVSASLDELNAYSDRTIYNFTEMTKNIGTFTAAGVGLEQSTAAIKGIANLAAVSGSNSQQASTAMYQLSQAMAAGKVQLMDWNSVVNAGMGGQIFQDSLKETARVMGINIDAIIADAGSFRDSLKEGWLSTDVLMNTLQKFTGDLTAEQLKSMGYNEKQIAEITKLGAMANDAATKVKTFSQFKSTMIEAIQSGWGQTWRLVLGDFEEAKTFFTDMSNTFGGLISESANARNNLLKSWKELGGRTMLVETVKNVFDGLLGVMRAVQGAFEEVFPPMTGQQLFNITKAIRDFSVYLKMGGDSANKLKFVFKGFFSIFGIAADLVTAVTSAIFGLLGIMKPSGNGLLDFLVNIASYVIGLRDAIKTSDIFSKAIYTVGGVLYLVGSKIQGFVNTAIDGFGQLQVWLSRLIKTGDVSGFVGGIGGAISKIPALMSNLFKNVDFSGVQNAFSKISSFLANAFKNVDFNGFIGFVNNATRGLDPLGKVGEFVSKVMTGLHDILVKLSPKFGELGENAKNGFALVGGAISGALKKIDVGAIWAGIIHLLSNIPVDAIISAIQGGLLAAILLGIKRFVGSLTDFMGEAKGMLSGVTSVLDGVKTSLEAWQKSLQAQTLLKIAGALGILTVSIIALSFVDSAKLAKALLAMTVMFKELQSFMDTLGKSKADNGATKLAVSLIGVSAALLIMSLAMTQIANIDPEMIGQGLMSVGLMLAMLSGFSKSLRGSSGKVMDGAGQIIIFALGLEIMVDVIRRMGAIDLDVLRQGLIGVGIVMLELAVFAKLLSSGNGAVIKSAFQVIIFAGALEIMADVVRRFGEIDVETLKRGLLSVGALMLELAIFMKVTNLSGMGFGQALGILALAGALLVMSEVVKVFAAINPDAMAAGLTRIGLILGELAIFVAVIGVSGGGGVGLIGTALGLVVLGGALFIFIEAIKQLGVLPWEVIGKGLAAIAGILVVLGLSSYLLAPLVPVLMGLAGALALLGLSAFAVGAGLLMFSLGLAGVAASGYGAALALLAIAKLFAQNAPLMASYLETMLRSMIKVIELLTPPVIDALEILLLRLIDMIIVVAPKFNEAILLIIAGLLESLAAVFPDFVQAGYDLLIALLKGLRDNIGEIVKIGIEVSVKFINGIASKLDDVIQAGYNLAIAFVNGLANAIEKNHEPMLKAVGALVDALIKTLCDGIVGGIKTVVSAIDSLVGAAIDALKILLGLGGGGGKSGDHGGPAESVGADTAGAFARGLSSQTGTVAGSAAELGKQALDGFGSVIADLSDYISANIETDPVIKPVLDLTDVLAGARDMNNALATDTINLSAAVDRLPIVETKPSPKDNNTTTSNGETVPQEISFVQNNYSPEALSHLEIYRQTKRQISTLKDVLLTTPRPK